MKQIVTNTPQEEYLRVLGKGMVTIPKNWRVELGLDEGDIVKAKKEGNKLVIEKPKGRSAPYRIFTSAEIDEFLREDRLPRWLFQKVRKDLST